MKVKNAFYAQSGGVSAAGVIEVCRQNKSKIGKLYSGLNGIVGALREELIDTSFESDDAISQLLHTPGGAFGSCRYKLKKYEDGVTEYERLIKVFRTHNIGYFFYNGGGDSADTCLKVSQISEKMGYPIRASHIPKTIDNDLPFTDYCPGFGSVAKYVATSVREASLDIQSMCASSTKVFILEVMGRHAGWIAASGGLAASKKGEAPHIILFPEIPFYREAFIERIETTVRQKGYCVIVASEGIRYSDGAHISGSMQRDAFGHQQLGGVAPTLASMIKQSTGYKYHWALSDYLQRSARHLASKIDVDHAYAAGRRAVEMALEGKTSLMVTIEREKGEKYKWFLGEASLEKVANMEKKMPRNFITKDGFGITKKAKDYLKPLIIGEDFPPFKSGLPQYVKLKNILTAKKLKSDFHF